MKTIPVLFLALLLFCIPAMALDPESPTEGATTMDLLSPAPSIESTPKAFSKVDVAVDALYREIEALRSNISNGVLDVVEVSSKLGELKKITDNVHPIHAEGLPIIPEIGDLLTIGAGAGLGFLTSGLVMTGVLGPVTQSLATGLGLSWMTARMISNSFTTIGVVFGTYAGGMYARNLVVD